MGGIDESCAWCGNPEVYGHHIIYRSHGGPDDPSNIIYLCYKHHDMVHSEPGFMIKILKSLRNHKEWRWSYSYDYLIIYYGGGGNA